METYAGCQSWYVRNPMVAARLLLFLLGLLSATNTARAYEDEFGIAAAAGYSLARGHGRNLQGVSVGTILDYGLAEYWSIRARLEIGRAHV